MRASPNNFDATEVGESLIGSEMLLVIRTETCINLAATLKCKVGGYAPFDRPLQTTIAIRLSSPMKKRFDLLLSTILVAMPQFTSARTSLPLFAGLKSVFLLVLCTQLSSLISQPLSAATVSWIGGSGDWNTTANWSTGALPGPDDDVVIDRPGDITVTHSGGAHSVKSILSQMLLPLTQV